MQRNWPTISFRLPEGPAGIHGLLVIALSVTLGAWMVWSEIGLRSLLVPAAGLGVILGHSRLLAAVLPLLLLWLLAHVGDYGAATVPGVSGLTQVAVCCAGLGLIISVFRYQYLVKNTSPGAIGSPSGDVGGAVSSRTESNSTTFDPAEVKIWALAVFGCVIAAGFWLVWLDVDSFDTVLEYGLLPEGLATVRLILSVFLAFLIAHSVLSYARWRHMSTTESRMRLQHTIWKWCGNEQKLVVRLQQRLRKD